MEGRAVIVYRIDVIDYDDLPTPHAYTRIDGRHFKTVEYAARAISDAYEETYRGIPESPGSTHGPTHAREYFDKIVYFPKVNVVEVLVEDSHP
jgi:hypothetical protein